MLPERLLNHDLRGEEVVPRWLVDEDLPWIDLFLAQRNTFVGSRQRELDDFLSQPLSGSAPLAKARLVAFIAARLAKSKPEATLDPKRARTAVFREAAVLGPRDAFARAAATLHLEEDVVREALFADLPGERRVAALEPNLRAWDIALLANQELLLGYLERASVVHAEVEGDVHRLARAARLRGLIVGIQDGGAPNRLRLEISGPWTLFRKTRLYGYALGELVPRLGAMRSFHVDVRVELASGSRMLAFGPKAPVFPWPEPRPFQSRLERRFARAVEKSAPGWRVEREPPPIVASGMVVLPDIAFVRESDGVRRHVEIVGFWTKTHLERKLAKLRAAGVNDLVLCVDVARNCGEGDVPQDPAIVAFSKSLDLEAVLRATGAAAPRAVIGGSLNNI